jgi:hypothetical protein
VTPAPATTIIVLNSITYKTRPDTIVSDRVRLLPLERRHGRSAFAVDSLELNTPEVTSALTRAAAHAIRAGFLATPLGFDHDLRGLALVHSLVTCGHLIQGDRSVEYPTRLNASFQMSGSSTHRR